ncbi:Alpha/Beta hydrolase protein [Mycena floridula]|nr:Alpha/Beta hydrolase protein [Mycena floridula]
MLLIFLWLVGLSALANASTNLTYVKDSGVCETTPGVHQMSGYINVTPTDSMWFWFFESRNSPSSAPLTLWFSGGPGCSSMIGLFEEIGPCTVDSNSNTVFNPYSWTNVTNLLFIDQPIGAGFSVGETLIKSTDEAAEYLWNALQILFADITFSTYLGRDLIIATESFGAHFGSIFVHYFSTQNTRIDSGEIQGVKLVVTGLSISDGKHDPLIQYATSLQFAQDAPGYGPLVKPAVLDRATQAFESFCRPQLQNCYGGASDVVCSQADLDCNRNVFLPLVGTRDPSDLRQQAHASNPFPPSNYLSLIRSQATRKLIGATTTFDQCDNSVKARFIQSGETGRSFLPPLASLADAKFPLLIWAGDADMKANWIGVHQGMVSMNWYGNQTLNNTAFVNVSSGGQPFAESKAVDRFTFARVYQAGHQLPSFQPQAALYFFSQFVATVANQSSTSTSTFPTATASPISKTNDSRTNPIWTLYLWCSAVLSIWHLLPMLSCP